MGLGGSYLKKPITEKVSEHSSNSRLSFGASSMQGWRISQEDAHNCILDFDEEVSFFAVYDGHGGCEVAKYTSNNLPEYVKKIKGFVDGNYEEALIESFLGFDETLTKPTVIAEMTKLAQNDSNNSPDNITDESDEIEDDSENAIIKLRKEATMPLEEVIAKYKSTSVFPRIRTLDSSAPASPFLRAKKEPMASSSASLRNSLGESSDEFSKKDDCLSSSTMDKSEDAEAKSAFTSESNESSGSNVQCDEKADEPKAPTLLNGDSETAACSSKSAVNGEDSKKEEFSMGDKKRTTLDRLHKKAAKISMQKLDSTCLNDDSDSEDESYVVANTSMEDDDDDDETEDGEGEEAEDEDEEGVEEDDEEEEEEDEDSDDEFETDLSTAEVPGSDSGCTAVVALIVGNKLYVANAGDSRCVISNKGVAYDMSLDHKPEDKPERSRIEAAGGVVSCDGRVNGGLNLSRALGDHSYKNCTLLPNTEQMITALPEVKSCDITTDMDFLVLACDGIWNSLTSQEVVDFVKERINKVEKLSDICEQMFDHCLAKDTLNDGTGCDNMTCIIIKPEPGAFPSGQPEAEFTISSYVKIDREENNTAESEEPKLKRCADEALIEEEGDNADAKRQKTDDDSS